MADATETEGSVLSGIKIQLSAEEQINLPINSLITVTISPKWKHPFISSSSNSATW